MGTHMDTAPDITLYRVIPPKKQQKIP